MATNWWEIGKPVQDFQPVAQEKKEQNWWEIGTPVLETETEQAAEPLVAEARGQPPVEPVPQEQRRVKPNLLGSPLDLLSLSFPEDQDPRFIGAAGGVRLIGSGLEAVSRLAGLAPDTTTTAASPAIAAIKSVSPQLQKWADNFYQWGEEIGVDPSTAIEELAENPAKAVPFIIERVIGSVPDMLAASYALPAYIPTIANDILNQRLENDGRTIEQATVGDVAAATAAAFTVGPLEKFATRRLGDPTSILGQTALQAGTEAAQEAAQYTAETAGTQVGFDPQQAALSALEGAIVGGGIGATFGGVNTLEQRAIRRDIEDRFRRGEDVRSEEELVELDKLREQAFQDAQSIAAPDLPDATDPLQFGTAYSERIYDSIGQYIPANEEFKVEEKTVEGTPRFVVTDREGTQYGQALLNQAQAESLSNGLNNTTQERRKILEQLYPLQRSLSEIMKGFGLNDIGLTLDRRIFTRRGEALTSEGLFDPVTRQVFLAVDAIDPDGTRDFAQRREALRGVLRHEVVHALRYLDLWKKSEWKNLEKTVSKLKKPGTEQTYLDIARTNYGDQSQVIQMEEAVADLIRDVAGNLSRVAGKPRSLSERAINFFDRAKNALTGAGFQTYEDIVRRVEEGIVGSRQRGRIRTLRATEEQLGERGITPERIQPLFETPEARNQFRVETAQRMQTEAPATSQPAINSINLNAVRESRSTIDSVPPKIMVDEQELPTRDSEGRLIYSGTEGQDVFGIPTRPTQEGIRNFWNWFGKSQTKDKQGRPQLFYHGTARDITEFRPKQAGSVFVTRSPTFAEEFAFLSDNYMVGNFTDFLTDQQILETLDEALQSASAFSPKLYDQMVKARDQAALDVQNGRPIRPAALGKLKEVASEGRSSRYLNAIQKRLPSSANLMPIYVRAEKSWDYDNKDDVRSVVKRARENGADITPSMIEEIQQGNWQTIEGSEGNAPILDAIRELGYDSMFVEEAGQKNLAVFDPGQIKSAIGNNGNFDVSTPSIRESRAPREKTLEELDAEIAELDAKYAAEDAAEREKVSEVESFARRAAQFAFDFQKDYSDLQDSIDSSRENVRETLKENPFGPNSTRYEEQAFAAYDAEVERLRQKESIAPRIRESRKFPAKSTPEDTAMAQEYLNRTGELPYLSEGQLEPVVPVARQSIKKPYEAKDLAKGRENDPISGLPLNKNGTVTLYFPATNEVARRTIQDKRLRGATPESNRIYLTNESSGPRVMENPGNIDQAMDGANVMIHVDPSLIHFDQEFEDGRKDFFVQLAEGKSYADKMRQTRLFTLDAPRTRALSADTKLVDIERSVTNSINNYLSLNAQERRARLKQAREVLKTEHNVGTLMGENGKLQKTRLGDYGLTYDDKSVASMGLGLASAQRINEQNLSTCPLSAMCEGLCLGETSGQNLLYGGEGQFKSGPRLSQYLKTEALVQHPEEFAIVLHEEIAKFEKWANSEKGVEQVENETGERVMQPKQVYQPAIRLNVTSDFRPQTFASIIEAFPNVMFYDYTKLPTRSIAPNHHLTYSSTGASQVVNGEIIVNPGSNWDKMVQRLNEGLNVAMAFTSRKDMPDFIVDEKTGQQFQVWNGDNYDARFLDPKRPDGIGMVVGLTNKDKTTKPDDAAKKWKGFFLDYNRERDGDSLIIRDQTKLRLGVAPAAPPAAPPTARESRLTGPASVTIPGPETDTDTTGAAEALNEGQPVNSLGIPTGPLLTYTMPDGTVVPFEDELDLTPRARESRTQEAIRQAELRPLMKRIVTAVEFFESAPDKLRGGVGLGDIAKRIEDYYDTRRARLGEVNQIIRNTTRRMNGRQLKSSQDTFERYIRARENNRVQDAKNIFNGATENDKKLILAWNEVAGVTGRVNRDVRGPDGEPIKVFDSNLKEWRSIGTIQEQVQDGVVVKGFFPRSLRREVMEVMMNPKLDPILYDQLLDAVVASGKTQTRDEAEDFLLKDYFTDEVKNDYFAGVEKARAEGLPEIFYDYSWEAATRYLSKWANRTSQIEFFGQELGPFERDWFDTNIPKIRNRETQEYLNQIRNRIYEVDTFGFWNNAMRWGNVLASGLQLGNPASAFLNFVGGDVANIQMYGWKEVAKAHAELVKDWKKVQEEGTRLGILNTDYLRILQDSERDAGKYFSATDKVGDALSKFTDKALTFSGFNGAENIVRATAMLAARGFLDNSLRAVNRNPASAKAKKFTEYVKRENLDLDKLILENGAGPETDRFMRRSVNVAQGSYEIDMTPVFVDTNIGRFLFKYQKFGTQINRFFYRNFLKPFLDEPTDVIKFLRLLAFVIPSLFGGEIINQFRRFLGYGGDYGPTYAQMAKAFEKEETAKAFGLLFSRAVQNVTIAGSFGFVGNYYQLGVDIADQQRVKNPMSPPALASVSAIYDLMYRVMDQGQLTARDLDEIAENTMSFYRANKRIALAGMSELGVESKEVDRFVAQRDVREIRRYGLRYAQDMELEGTRQRSFSGPPVRTEMTPTNKAIVDALYQGDSARARVLMRNALKGKPYSERQKINQSIRASIRIRQPVQIGGTAPNNQERMDFLRWARKNLSAEEYQKINTMDRSYRRAAARIGMGFGG
jgi:mRNA-degrading endonuclease RelE of RelBE toxin-antitoxin system